MPLYDVSISVLCKDVPRLRCLSHEKLIRVSVLPTVSRGRNSLFGCFNLARWHLVREPDAIFQDAALCIPMSMALKLLNRGSYC